MLVKAYTMAEEQKNYSELQSLHELIQTPYTEGSMEQIQKYYRRSSDEALVTGGTAFMSCSS